MLYEVITVRSGGRDAEGLEVVARQHPLGQLLHPEPEAGRLLVEKGPGAGRALATQLVVPHTHPAGVRPGVDGEETGPSSADLEA